MSDDPSKRGPADRSRVNIHEAYEVRYWCEKWGVTPEQLKTCVGKVGPMVKDVATCLGKSP